ncbi:hypothetical protein WOLCODRAFT_154082 [Wolfiporia cocos MD-104 SS10]|uniref:Uncharacterized protein n=1 Tax=Wolfiporia cocos (strain MD-104) TaxID=742152 RepID=A0A2H3JRA7_WOLCO|nr:hypothetical protein WOLCODRAFT_154082 [Wolfiporia cocos MD-104 SS10]
MSRHNRYRNSSCSSPSRKRPPRGYRTSSAGLATTAASRSTSGFYMATSRPLARKASNCKGPVCPLPPRPSALTAFMVRSARLRGEDAAPLARLKVPEASGARGGGGGEDLVSRASLEVAGRRRRFRRRTRRSACSGSGRQVPTHRASADARCSTFNSQGAEFREAVEDILCVKFALHASGDIHATWQYDLTTQFMLSRQWSAHAAREAGRGRASGLPAAHTLLDWRGALHLGLHRIRHAGVVRERQAEAARYACGLSLIIMRVVENPPFAPTATCVALRTMITDE